MSEYYTKDDLYAEKFYPLPKVFLSNPYYKKGLTDTEKIAYAILKDRFSLSAKNNWFDDKGHIYFIFSQQALMDLFDCSKQTASNIKSKLIKLGLLEKKTWGQGKPDWLYLKKPVVTDNDIYKINEAESLGAVEESKNKTSKSLKNRPQEVQKVDAIDTNINNTDINKTDYKRLVTSKDIIDFCNSLYTKYSVGRWSKRQWNTMIKKFVSEINWNEVKHIKAYCISSIENMAYKHDFKNGLIEKDFNFEGQSVPFYNWLEN